MSLIRTIETTSFSTFSSKRLKRTFQWNSINGHRSVSPEPIPKKSRIELHEFQTEERQLSSFTIPAQQTVLLLHGKGQRYVLEPNYIVPNIKNDDELLIKVQYIGLNPIDWKSA